MLTPIDKLSVILHSASIEAPMMHARPYKAMESAPVHGNLDIAHMRTGALPIPNDVQGMCSQHETQSLL